MADEGKLPEAATNRSRLTALRKFARPAALIGVLGIIGAAFWSAAPIIIAGLALAVALILAFADRADEFNVQPESMPARPPAEWLGDILNSLPQPVIVIDRRGIVLQANASALSTFSSIRLDVPVSFAFRMPNVIEAVDHVLKSDEEARTEINDRVPSPRSFELIVRRIGVTDGEPGSAFAVLVMNDTSDIRRVEAMRVDFVANASHELRTPLASILGFIETLRGRARDDAAARANFLEIMEGQARRMARLIDDLLSLSKIEMSAHIPPEGLVDLVEVTRTVVDSLAGIARDRGVRLDLDLAEQAIVAGDRDELVRAAENLVENAIKYGQSGGRVDIGLMADQQAQGGEVVFSVRDYGPGISSEHLPRLTERFYRADVAESRVLGGTGLGLAIVKHIVARHRGRLQIESRRGEGATFTITLPLHLKNQ